MIIKFSSLLRKASRPAILLPALVVLLSGVYQGCTTNPENSRSFKSIFDHYRDKENVAAISFPPGLITMFLSENNPEMAELAKLMKELSAFRMLSIGKDIEIAESNNEIPASSGELKKELADVVSSYAEGNGFQELFRLQSGGEDIWISVLEAEGYIREALMTIDSDGSFFVINLRGTISPELVIGLVQGGHLDKLTKLSDLGIG